MSRTRVFGAALAALFVLPAPAEAGVREDTVAIRKGLRQAVAAGRLTPSEAAAHRLTLRRARAVLTLLGGSRRTHLAGVLGDVAAQWRRYNRPRALALFSMLQANADFLAVRGVPAARTDIVAGDGVVYRLFAGHGFQFHPLGNFAALNAHVTARRDAAAARLAAALVARAVPRRGALVWEYYFPFGIGRPPWTAGMAQAVAAQALARAGARLEGRALLRAAARAYAAIPGPLLFRLERGPWIRHYSFHGMVVLNAQLQSVLSLSQYAGIVGDDRAAALARRMDAAARALFPRFDTGYWSLYALGVESPLKYHEYVVTLLRQLARRTGDEFWAAKADRFALYLRQPPRLRLLRRLPPLYPIPADGFRDQATVRFWLSKPSRVTLAIAGETVVRSLGSGRHAFVWRPGRRPPREYRLGFTAVDLAGNRASGQLARIEVRRDTQPPEITARLRGRRLFWKAVDEGTPWLRLVLRLERPKRTTRIDLGRRPLRGSLPLRPLRLRWQATLVASDSTGNRARVTLGPLGGRN